MVFGQAPQPGLLKTELLLDDSEGMLDLRADVGLGRLDQILHPSIRCVWHGPAFAGPYRHSEFLCLAGHLSSFGDALVASIAVDNLLITMQHVCSWGEVEHVGGRNHHRMDQA